MIRSEAINQVKYEHIRATVLHPAWPTNPIHQAAILCEETGELVRAALRVTFEGADWSEVVTECVQSGAMAMRIVTELGYDAADFLLYASEMKPYSLADDVIEAAMRINEKAVFVAHEKVPVYDQCAIVLAACIGFLEHVEDMKQARAARPKPRPVGIVPSIRKLLDRFMKWAA